MSDLDILTGYDPVSLMNYCSARGFDPQKPLTLSSEDTVAIRKLFGSTKPDAAALAPTSGGLTPAAATPQQPGLQQDIGAGTMAATVPTPPAPAPPTTPPAGAAATPEAAEVRSKPQHPLFDPN